MTYPNDGGHFSYTRKTGLFARLAKSNKPEKLLLRSFLIVILIGSLLLSLPYANLKAPVSYLNNLFVAVSAVCVTGLSTVTVAEQYSLFGKIVLILLMQVGGLGPMTIIAIVIQRSRRRMATVEKKLFAAASGKSNLYDVPGYIRRIIRYTLVIELAGFILLSLRFMDIYPIRQAMFNALFLAVSAFTNAGFDCLGPDSLIPFAADPAVNLIVMTLIITGGLGFVVWFELRDLISSRMKKGNVLKRSYKYLSVHARVVIRTTVILLLTGMMFFYINEAENPLTLAPADAAQRLFVSMFQSVTLRTAGFATVNIGSCTRPMLLIMCVYMLIGGSPGGTAGGIKTTTASVLFRSAMNFVFHSKPDAVIRSRRIAPRLLTHAFTVLTLYIAWLFIAILALTISEPGIQLLPLMFEAFSAIATVGLTTGITASLSAAGRITIIILMFVGRLGPLSLFMAFQKEQKESNHVVYPDANIIIG